MDFGLSLLLVGATVGFVLSLTIHVLTFARINLSLNLLIGLVIFAFVVGTPSYLAVGGYSMDTWKQLKLVVQNTPRWLSIPWIVLLIYILVNLIITGHIYNQWKAGLLVQGSIDGSADFIRELYEVRLASSALMWVYFSAITSWYIMLNRRGGSNSL